MPLALVVEKIDTVPEALRGEYTEKDGKFHLNVEGLPDVAGLKSALEAERATNKTTKEAIAAWKKIGRTPEEIAELVTAKEAAEAEAAKKAGNFDAILGQHRTKWDGEKAALVGERDVALNAARAAVVDAGILSSLSQNKVTAEGSAILPRILGDRVKTEFVNGKFVTNIVQPDGETPMIGSGPNGVATYDDLVKETIKKFPSLFEGTGAGGGGTPPKGGGGSGAKTMPKAEFDALTPKERAAKMAEPGFKLT